MSEEQIVNLSAPTPAGIKLESLFRVAFQEKETLIEEICNLNRMLRHAGIVAVPLLIQDKAALMQVTQLGSILWNSIEEWADQKEALADAITKGPEDEEVKAGKRKTIRNFHRKGLPDADSEESSIHSFTPGAVCTTCIQKRAGVLPNDRVQ